MTKLDHNKAREAIAQKKLDNAHLKNDFSVKAG